MAFTVKTRKADGVVIVDMNGRLMVGEAQLNLRETIRRFIADGNSNFVLNLSEVSQIDSAGLGELVTTYTSVRNRDGKVALLGLSNRIKGLLQITKLLTVFDSFDDESSAVASVKS